jgi:molybdopterin converting factor small subunit
MREQVSRGRDDAPTSGGEAVITVTARFLAIPPGALEKGAIQLEVPPGTSVGDLIALLVDRHPVLRSYSRFLSASVNRAYVGMQTELLDGDEVIYSPPVGGG